MLRERHTWNKIIDIENCRQAVLEEAKTPRCLRKGISVELRGNTDRFANEVKERLADGFIPHPYVEFDICEYGKTRHIEAPDIQDAMCHRATSRIMEPLVYKRMVPTSYCPVEGRGGLKLARDLRRKIHRCDETCRIHNLKHRQPWRTWILKSDIYHYYPSITFNVAIEAMLKIFDEAEITNYLTASLQLRDGLPIGAGFSSMIANAILMQIDWLIVGNKNVRGYARYMDDMVAVLRSKKAAGDLHEEMEDALGQIGLTTANKWSKFPADHHAVEIGGWRISHKGIYPSGNVERHLRRMLRGKMDNLSHARKAALASLYGYVKNGDSLTLKRLWKDKNADSYVFS